MIGREIKLDDYKFTFGKDDVFVKVYGAFKYKNIDEKYIIYSYDNKKLYYGSLFIRNNKMIVMNSSKDEVDVIKEFVNLIMTDGDLSSYDIISLEEVKSMQIIEEKVLDIKVDINKLDDKTIPKPVIKKEDVVKEKTKLPISTIFMFILILFVAAFFFINPEVILGKNEKYECSKNYRHDEIPANVNETLELTFNSKDVITKLDVKEDYVFTDINYYVEFRDNSYYYKYFDNVDTYKFEDSSYTFKLFSNADVTGDFFLPKDRSELISYYQENGYTCVMVGNK